MNTSWDIQGGTTPILRFNVASGESVHVQSGAYMSGGPDMKGEKVENSQVKKVGVFKRYLSGDFITWDYKNEGQTAQHLDVGRASAGNITAISCAGAGDSFLMENGAFFAMSNGICEISTQSTKQLRKNGAIAGLLSQGFTMQKLVPIPSNEEAVPTLFVESGGSLIRYDLEDGEKLKVNKSALFGFSSGTKMELKKVEKGRLRHMWAGEGFSNYVATGPGTVLVESRARASTPKKEGGLSRTFWGIVGVIGIGFANLYFFGDEDGGQAPNPEAAIIQHFFESDDPLTPTLPPQIEP